MSEMKLTAPQRRALLNVLNGRDNSYRMRASLSTCYALEDRGLLAGDRSRPGCFYSPQTIIKWRLTEKGREIAARLTPKEP